MPWCDAVYGCDDHWWRYRKGLPEFSGLKITWEGKPGATLDGHPEIRRVRIQKSGDGYCNRLLFDEPGLIGSGHNSGFQALNLVLQWGARNILLVGFDMRGTHWYGRNQWPRAANPDEEQFARSIRCLETAVPVLAEMGAQVINTSPTSALRRFRRASIEEALAGWS